MITSLLVGKTELTLNATIVHFLEAKKLMVQELGLDTSDRVLIMAKIYNKKKNGDQNNSKKKVITIARIMVIFNILVKT